MAEIFVIKNVSTNQIELKDFGLIIAPNGIEEFKTFVLDTCEAAAVELVDKLENIYPNMDIRYFIDLIDQSIDDFTYDSMNNLNDDDLDDTDELSGNYVD